jgi:hypothetical protein
MNNRVYKFVTFMNYISKIYKNEFANVDLYIFDFFYKY